MNCRSRDGRDIERTQEVQALRAISPNQLLEIPSPFAGEAQLFNVIGLFRGLSLSDCQVKMQAKPGHPVLFEGEEHGLSVFFRLDEDVFHSDSVYARGCEALTNAYRLHDATPYGRQQDFEDSPSGWPLKPAYG